MPRRRNPTPPPDAPKAQQRNNEQDPGAFSVAGWAQKLLKEVAAAIPEESLALLAAQARSLGRDTPATAALPPDPTRPVIIKDQRSLKALAARVAQATEVVVDL